MMKEGTMTETVCTRCKGKGYNLSGGIAGMVQTCAECVGTGIKEKE
jgi:DnaJ-class molecular chaperone